LIIFCFDIDDTIVHWNPNRDYANFAPDKEMVRIINGLYDQGHYIKLFTARGMNSVGPDGIKEAIIPPLLENLQKIGLKYHELMTHKPVYDMIIDDKAIDPWAFKELYHRGELDDMIEDIESEKQDR